MTEKEVQEMEYKDSDGKVYKISYSQELQLKIVALLAANAILLFCGIILTCYVVYRLDKINALSKLVLGI